jgi:hypothetical protein
VGGYASGGEQAAHVGADGPDGGAVGGPSGEAVFFPRGARGVVVVVRGGARQIQQLPALRRLDQGAESGEGLVDGDQQSALMAAHQSVENCGGVMVEVAEGGEAAEALLPGGAVVQRDHPVRNSGETIS